MSAARRDRNHRRFSGGDGFSLIELLAVMVVAGILAGAAAVSLSAAAENRAAVAARQLQGDLNFARRRAVATGTRCWVSFDLVAQEWSLLAEDASSPGRAGAAVLADPATNAPFTQRLDEGPFAGVQLSVVDFDGEDWVGFDWLGRPLGQSSETTPLTADGTVTLTGGHQLTLDRHTGLVTRTGP